jgi:hypothetical protein
MRVAIYARASTDDKGQDPENQLRELRDWASNSGHTISREYVDYESGRKGAETLPPHRGVLLVVSNYRARSSTALLANGIGARHQHRPFANICRGNCRGSRFGIS